MTRLAIVFSVLALGACKKHEPVQQAAPTETGPIVASTAPSVSVTADTIASAPITSASVVASASAVASSAGAPTTDAEKDAARKRALEEAREFGMIGLVPVDAGEFGAGGLGLSGVGEGGGRGEGIGLGTIGTLGHADGGASSSSHAPSIRQGSVTVNGRLPPEVIQRIVRQNFGRYRLCYTTGLRSNPNLQGRVATRFVIDRDGSVKSTQDAGSDMPDQNVTNCVVRAFGNLSFPQPEGGIVTVVFPLIFTPGS